jgi:hypothetical protein
MKIRLGKWEPVEAVLGQSTASHLLVKSKEEGSRYHVQLELGTRHRKDSLHNIGRDKARSIDCFAQYAVELIQKVQYCSDSGRVTYECWGHVGPWLCKEAKIKKER